MEKIPFGFMEWFRATGLVRNHGTMIEVVDLFIALNQDRDNEGFIAAVC